MTSARGTGARDTHRRVSHRPAGWTSKSVAGSSRRYGSVGDVGLPEVVGFAIGAGVMATALAALEAGLAGNDRARRLARDGGVRAELERAAADFGWRRVPLPRTAPAGESILPPAGGRRQKSWASS